MIIKPEEMDFTNHKIAIIVAGLPGIGKTTLALSAPKPLLVDLDKGVSRVEAKYRSDTLAVTSFDELVSELKNEDLSAYETIVLDTGGKLFELMKPSIIKKDPKCGKSDGTLSLQGYGVAKRKYSEFVNFVKGLGKNLVMVFHASEVVIDPQDQTTGLRIRIEGGTKDEIWDDMDLGCFMEMKGNKRTIGFGNCERYYAKGTHGIHGIYEIPNLENGGKNDFLTQLFKKVNDDLNAQSKEAQEYKKTMGELLPLIQNAKDAEALTKASQAIQNAKHVSTTKDELRFALMNKAKELKLTYDKATNAFVGNSKPIE